MDITAEQVTAFAACVSAAGIGFIYWQARTMNIALKADHERSRRLTAVSMLQLWDERLSQRASMARKLVESFDFAQSKSLWSQDTFEIDSRFKEQAYAVLPELAKEEGIVQNGRLTIQAKYSTLLRWELVSYLNSLETILSSWQHNIADREMLEEQFEYLVRPEDGHYLLKEFRKASGGSNTYPCIESFVTHLEKKRAAKDGKGKIA